MRGLLVEDNHGDATLIRALLRSTPFRFEHVTDMAAALVRLGSERFDVVLLDLRLPDGHDLAVVEKIVPSAGNAATIVLTGLDDDDVAHACLDAGAQDYVRKSDLSQITLVRSIKHAMVRQRAAELARRLEAAERHAALGQIAAGVAHEINNRTTVLLASAETARVQLEALRSALRDISGEELDQLGDAVDHLSDGVGAIAEIVSALQTFSAQDDPAAIEPVDIADVVRRTVGLVFNSIRQRARIITEVTVGPMAAANPRKLGQVLINLLNNAVDAVAARGVEDAVIRVVVEPRADAIAIAVEDNGTGIADEVLPRLFEPFFTSKPSGRGTGLGLAISAEIVASFGGRIEVDTQVGLGSTFTVLVPIASRALVERPRSGGEVASQVVRRRVLLVDDDDGVRQAVAGLLSVQHDVVQVAGGAEALALVEGDSAFDAMLCDLMMPGVDGAEVAAVLRERYPALYPRLALLSGGAFSDIGGNFLETTDRPVLAKPCRRAQLLAIIDELATAN